MSCYIINISIGVKTNHEYVLTDPCLLSNNGGHYGTTDCGNEFIINWFNKHKCNKYCDPKWKKATGKIVNEDIICERSTSYIWELDAWAEMQKSKTNQIKNQS